MQVFKEDAVEWLSTLADASVDLVITDPPYESLEKHRKNWDHDKAKGK